MSHCTDARESSCVSVRTSPLVAKREGLFSFPAISGSLHPHPSRPFSFYFYTSSASYVDVLHEGVIKEEKHQNDLNRMKISVLLGKMTEGAGASITNASLSPGAKRNSP